jgi:hypothetical protein
MRLYSESLEVFAGRRHPVFHENASDTNLSSQFHVPFSKAASPTTPPRVAFVAVSRVPYLSYMGHIQLIHSQED